MDVIKHAACVRRRSARAWILVGALALYWSALCIATHLPGRFLAGTGPIASDKTLHFLAYGGLGALLAASLRLLGLVPRHSVWVALIVAAMYGVLDELGQIPVPGRTAELGDWIADVIGATIGAGGWWIMAWAVRARACDCVAQKKPSPP